MTRDSPETRTTTRRTLLRRGVIATGALVFSLSNDRITAVRRAEATSHGSATAPETKLSAADGDDDDRYGWAVDIDGDTAVIGARDDEEQNGWGAGAAYVYVRSGGGWSEQAKLVADDGDGGNAFGHAVGVSGDTIVVGSPFYEDPNGTDAGSAYVFTRAGSTWTQAAKLSASDGAADDQYGWAVDIDGDTVVVGARTDQVPNAQLGDVTASSTYVYVSSGGSWVEEAKLVVSDSPNDDLVSAVALNGDTLVVGDLGDTLDGGDISGAAYVFSRSGGSWSQPTTLVPADNDRDDAFGRSVAVDGDTIVVGASGDEDPNGPFAGSAYVYERSGTGWSEGAKIAADDGVEGDEFGWAVGVDGDTIVVGPRGVDDPAGGSAYVFERDGGNWTQARALRPTDGERDDLFGSALAVAGSSVVVGAPGDADPNGTDAGSAYIFDLGVPPTAAFTVAPTPAVRGDSVTFDASGSTDADGSIVDYEWDWDGDGTFDQTTTDPVTTHTFTTGGERTVTLRVTDDGGTTTVESQTVAVHIHASIDVKPGGGKAPINPRSRGLIPVAVLHTAAFDAPAEIDPATVRFGAPDVVGFDGSGTPTGGATPAHGDGHVEDVDGNGADDLLFHFPTQDTGFDAGDTEAELVGLTTDGVPVFGTADIRTVGR